MWMRQVCEVQVLQGQCLPRLGLLHQKVANFDTQELQGIQTGKEQGDEMTGIELYATGDGAKALAKEKT